MKKIAPNFFSESVVKCNDIIGGTISMLKHPKEYSLSKGNNEDKSKNRDSRKQKI